MIESFLSTSLSSYWKLVMMENVLVDQQVRRIDVVPNFSTIFKCKKKLLIC